MRARPFSLLYPVFSRRKVAHLARRLQVTAVKDFIFASHTHLSPPRLIGDVGRAQMSNRLVSGSFLVNSLSQCWLATLLCRFHISLNRGNESMCVYKCAYIRSFSPSNIVWLCHRPKPQCSFSPGFSRFSHLPSSVCTCRHLFFFNGSCGKASVTPHTASTVSALGTPPFFFVNS